MNDLYVTKRTKFHWKDLKHVINFVDNLTEIAQRMNAGFWMGLIRPMVHTLNKTNCVHRTLVKSLILMLMHKLYISSTICYNWFLFYISTEIAPYNSSRIDFPAWSSYTCAC